MFRPRLALNLAALVPPGDPTAIPRLRAIGYDAVALDRAELGGNVTAAARLAGTLAASGLSVAWVTDDGGPDLSRTLDLAGVVGARDVVVRQPAWPPDQPEPSEREAVAQIVAGWRAAASRAAAGRHRLLWDVGAGGSLAEPGPAEQILRGVAASNLGIVLDSSTPTWLDRFKGAIGGVRWAAGTDEGTADRLVPTLVDAWLPSRWWIVDPSGSPDPWRSAADAASLLDRLLTRAFPRPA